MKKILLIAVAIMCMANSDCEGGSFEQDIQTYLVLDKGKDVSSHFNVFHKDGFSVETDYFVTFKNVKTNHVFVYECRSADEFYRYQKGKKYRCRRFRKDNKY